MSEKAKIDSVSRFDGRVGNYALYRARYMPELVLPRLRDWCGLAPDWTVADIGAGTGQFADLFLSNGNRVLAVEPNPEMRAACASLHRGQSRLSLSAGTAEATGLSAASVQMVGVGRALHWFDLDHALAEFGRILVPGGWVAIVSFGRTVGGRAENEALEALLRRRTEANRSTRSTYEIYHHLRERFPAAYEQERIDGELTLDWERLCGMVLSLSHAPLSTDDDFSSFVEALRALFDRHADADGQFTLATACWINAGRLG